MNKNVLHVFRNLKFGGNQALALDLIKCSSAKYNHSILSLQNDLEMLNEFSSLGCDIQVIPHKESSFSDFKERFNQFIKENNVSTVVTWFYPYVLRLEIPEVKFVHHIGTAPLKKPLKQWIKNYILVNFYRRSCGEFVFASNYISTKNKQSYGTTFKNSQVIHNGIDIRRFYPKKVYDHISSFVITMVGRLDGSKDFDTLIRVAKELSYSINNLRINIVGDGNDRKRLEDLSKSTGASDFVFFLGKRSDVPNILHDSDLCVFLNKPLEGFGLVIVEAMSTALPVISYNFGANPEIIQNGCNGYLVENQAELIERILAIYTSPSLARELGSEARKTALRNFNVREMVKKYEKLY